jgi:hypothetical protein
VSQWPIYSVGSGTKWLYDREVLSKGLEGRPSDFGQLLENSFRWLATPSLRTHALGGHQHLLIIDEGGSFDRTARPPFPALVFREDTLAVELGIA